MHITWHLAFHVFCSSFSDISLLAVGIAELTETELVLNMPVAPLVSETILESIDKDLS